MLREENQEVFYNQVFRLQSLPILDHFDEVVQEQTFTLENNLSRILKSNDDDRDSKHQKHKHSHAPRFIQPMTPYGKKFNRMGVKVIQSTEVNKIDIEVDSYFKFEPVGFTFGFSTDCDQTKRNVLFCEEVLIKHVNSGEYLTIVHQFIEGRFKVMLTSLQKKPESDLSRSKGANKSKQNLQTNCTFIIKPVRSFEKAAGKIKYSSYIDIYNPKFDVHLYPEDVNEEFVLLASVGRHYKWKMYDYKQENEGNSKTIEDYDIVYIVSKLLDGKLSLKQTPEGTQLKVLQNYMSSPLIPEPKSFGCLWWVSNFSHKIEQENLRVFPDSKRGEYHSYEITQNLLNFITGKDRTKSKAPCITFTHFGTKKLMASEQTYIRYSPTDDSYRNPLQLMSGDYIKIKTGRGNHQKWLVEEKNTAQFKAQDKIGGKESNQTQQGSAFRIFKLNSVMTKYAYQFVQAKLKLEDCLQTILTYNTVIEYNTAVHNRFVFKLSIQTFYLLEYLEKELEDAQNRLKIQTMIFDVGLLKIILTFIIKLYEVFDDKFDTYRLKAYQFELDNLFILMHKIFRLCCANNYYIKEKILQEGACGLLELVIRRDYQELYEFKILQKQMRESRIVHDVFEHITSSLHLDSKLNSEDDLTPTETQEKKDEDKKKETPSEIQTLKELLSNNMYATQNVIKPDLIDKLIKIYVGLKYTLIRQERFLLIMRLLCRSGNEFVQVNQWAIIKGYFLNDKQQYSGKIRKVKFKIVEDARFSKILVYKGIKQDRKQQLEKTIFQFEKIEFYDRKNDEKFIDLREWYCNLNFGDEKPRKQNLCVVFQTEQISKKQIRERKKAHEWKVFEMWIQLLGDVSDGRNLQGQWLVGTILNRRFIQVLLDHKPLLGKSINQLKKYTTQMNKSFIRLINNYLVENSFNTRSHFNLVWIPKHVRQFRELQKRLKKQIPDRTMILHLQQYILAYLDAYERFSRNFNSSRISQRYMLQTIQIIKLFRNMLEFGLWQNYQSTNYETITAKQQKNKQNNQVVEPKMIPLLVKILKKMNDSTKQTNKDLIKELPSISPEEISQFKIYILQAIQYYLAKDARKRFQRIVAFDYQNYQIQVLNEDIKVVGSSSLFEQNILCIKNQTVVNLDNEIYFIIIDPTTNFELFSVAVTTRNAIMEVERNSYMMKRFALIVKTNDQNLDLIDLLNQSRQLFQMTLTSATKIIGFHNQYQLTIPIWDQGYSCLIKIIFEITLRMKSITHFSSNEFSQMYNSLRHDDSIMQPFTQLQNPSECGQKLVLQSGVMKYLIKFIEAFDHTNKNELYLKLIEAVYYLLSILFWRYSQSRKPFFKKWQILLDHAEHSSGALMALREYCRGSYWLQYSHERVNTIITRITQYLLRQIKSNKFIKAAKLLDFFSVLIKYNKQNLDKNKMLILINLFSKDIQKEKNPLLKKKRGNDKTESFSKWSQTDGQAILHLECGRIIEKQTGDVVYPKDLVYVITLYRLLGQLSESHRHNIVRCKKLHTFDQIIHILEMLSRWTWKAKERRQKQQEVQQQLVKSPQTRMTTSQLIIHTQSTQSNHKKTAPNWIFKLSIRNYLNTVYYQSLEERYYDAIRSRDIKNIIEDLNLYLRFKTTEGNSTKIKYKYKIRETYVFTVVEKHFLSVINTLNILFGSVDSNGAPQKQIYYDDNYDEEEQDNNLKRKKLQTKYNKFLAQVILELQSKEKCYIDYLEKENEFLAPPTMLLDESDASSNRFDLRSDSEFIEDVSPSPQWSADTEKGQTQMLKPPEAQTISKSGILTITRKQSQYEKVPMTKSLRLSSGIHQKKAKLPHFFERSRDENRNFNLKVFKTLLRIYERLNLLYLKITENESEIKSKLGQILKNMLTNIFQIDLQKKKLANQFKRKTNFLYRQVIVDLIEEKLSQLSKEDLQRVALVRVKKEYIEKAQRLKEYKNKKLTTKNQIHEFRRTMYETMQMLLTQNQITQFFNCNSQIYESTAQSNMVLSIYQIRLSLNKIQSKPISTLMSRINVDFKQNELTLSFGKYYKQKMFNKFHTFGEFKKAQIYKPISSNREYFLKNRQGEEYLKKFHAVLDKFIFKSDSQISEQSVEFYFRYMTKDLTLDKKAKKIPEGQSKKGDQVPKNTKSQGQIIQQTLNEVICNQIFKTIVNMRLQDHLKISHELFFFCDTYFLINSKAAPAPEPLMKLIIQEDSKNIFINNIQNLISYYIDDVVRNYRISKHKLYEKVESCYDEQKKFFVTQQHKNDYNLEKEINRRSTRECSKSIYRFIQLLCENNYVPFKRLFRQQKNKDGSLKPNNQNILILSTYELRRVFQVFSDQTNDQPYKIVNFLNQIAQIPCHQNIIQLVQSTFFEDVCGFILRMKSTQKKYIDKTYGEIALIIITFLRICVSILESNKSDICQLFSEKINSQFMSQVCNIFTENFQKAGQQKEKIEFWLREVKAMIIIIYKLLENHPKQSKRIMDKIKVMLRNELIDIRAKMKNQRQLQLKSKYQPKLQLSRENSLVLKINDLFGWNLYEKALNFTSEYKKILSNFRSKSYSFLVSLRTTTYEMVRIVLSLLSRKSLNQEDSDEEEDKVFLKQQLEDKEDATDDIINPREGLTHDHYNYMKDTVLSVEVSIEGEYHTLYFFKPEAALDINQGQDEEIQRILYKQLERESQKIKLQTLVNSLPQLEVYMRYRYYVKQTHYAFGHITGYLYNWATIVSLVINLLLIFRTQIRIQDQRAQYSFYPRTLLQILQVVQCLLSSLYCFSTLANAIKKAQLKKYVQYKQNNPVSDINEVSRLESSFQLKNVNHQDYFRDLTFLQLPEVLLNQISVIFYMVICLFGLFISPYFYSIHIFYLLIRIKVLQSVFEALFHNMIQLGALAMAGVACFFIFAIVSVDMFASLDLDRCHTIYSCLLVVYNRDAYLQKSDKNDVNLERLIFTLIYTVFFGQLLQSIISNIFSDGFAQLRAKNNLVQNDENNFCYICGMDRQAIQSENKYKLRIGKVFEHHKKLHNKWNYLYYIYELRERPSTDYTGIEYIIDTKCKEGDVSWFPIREKKGHSVVETTRQVNEVF